MREPNRGSWKAVAVDQYTRDGVLIAEYDSIAEACRKGGYVSNKISQCIHGHNHTHKGYVWRRKDERFFNTKQIERFR